MPFHFCPQCGTKLQPDFRFCPMCGEKLLCPGDESGPVSSMTSLGPSPHERGDTSVAKTSNVTPPKRDTVVEPTLEASSSPAVKSPRLGELKHKKTFLLKNAAKAKKAKQMPAVEPLQEGEEVADTTGKKWRLVKRLSQSTTELIYEVSQSGSQSSSKESNQILKLQQMTLLLKSAVSLVDKWIKQNKMDFLGIPSCVGFGLHADSYRFLIFSNMGEPLQSVTDEDKLLSEKAVLQLACRILNVLQYIHSNEYVHANINAENIYIKQGEKSKVFLAGYYHAFRYCPAGQHVQYREASRTPHEGAIEFISLDTHKGAGPSRRSDLQSLGYCMLCWHTGTLPWSGLANPDQVATQKQRYMDNVPALLSYCFGKKSVSSAFQTYLTAVMALQYSELPDYSALQAGLSAALLQLGGSLEQPITF
uniref:Protein kinase domain-containing protein n=1 Tax=Mola mola TaxID=94237 RepID=A0A3Q4BLY2_MOLML